MDDTQHPTEKDGVLEASSERREILKSLYMYEFSVPWRFEVPLDENSREFVSPMIRTKYEEHFNFVWRLNYNKAGNENFYNNCTLSLLSFDKRHLEVCVRCYFENGEYKKVLTEERSFDFNADVPITKEFTLWDSNLQHIYQNRLVDMLKNKKVSLKSIDSLQVTIRVQFEFLEMDYKMRTSLKLADDLKALQYRDELADVTISIGEKEFKAHKCVLAARSAVFARMFKAQENRDSKIRIDDIEPEIFNHLLKFIYCGKTNYAWVCNQLPQLRLAAEKFGLTV